VTTRAASRFACGAPQGRLIALLPLAAAPATAAPTLAGPSPHRHPPFLHFATTDVPATADSDVFVFLLSIRAGGVGLNLQVQTPRTHLTQI
jgi:hypothetical protein